MTIFFVGISYLSVAQTLTGVELLDKAIAFHDPNNAWKTFSSTFYVTMQPPKKSDRKSTITIDLPNQFFKVSAKRDTIITTYEINKKDCKLSLNGNKNPSEDEKKQHNLNCERANLYKNYYTYLYGLPMKLKDEGTIIHPKVERKKFKGKDYLVLKVTYDEKVGADTWYFYFNPKTYALEIYQFFKDTKDSGEYILLSEIETIQNIKMPKNRVWYYNKNNEYLGTDMLSIKK